MNTGIRDNKALVQGLALLAVGVLGWSIAVSTDAYEHFETFVRTYEDIQVDEIVLALVFAGILGFVYSLLRMQDLHREIVRRNKAEKDVSWIARHDSLTRLLNRRGLAHAIERIDNADAGEGHVVYSIDLDGFKKLNDLLGHQSGDDALIEVAQRLRSIFPTSLIFRLGGDEFLIIESVSAIGSPEAAGRRIIKLLSQPYMLSGSTAEMSASVGIALYPQHAADLQSVIRCADLAMYAAKKASKGSIVQFEPSMNETMLRRAEMELSLRAALKAGEIEPYYQPLVDLRTGALRGFEALARWHRDGVECGVPSDFIILAEETGMIVELSDQLLRKATREAKSWPAAMRLAFNISPVQLSDRLLGLRILQILDDVGFPPSRLEVEITETALVKDLALAELILCDLHEAGINIALDDFGTGYSSLSQLSKFKFDKIKIDRSFVAAFENDERQQKIVKAMLGLGQGLGLTTTAEGIETSSQMKSLQDLGCDFGQGYLFGKAMPGGQVSQLLMGEHRLAVG